MLHSIPDTHPSIFVEEWFVATVTDKGRKPWYTHLIRSMFPTLLCVSAWHQDQRKQKYWRTALLLETLAKLGYIF